MDRDRLRKLIFFMILVFILPAILSKGRSSFGIFVVLAIIAALAIKSKMEGGSKGLEKFFQGIGKKFESAPKTEKIVKPKKTINIKNMGNLAEAKKKFVIVIVIALIAWLFFSSIVIIDAGETGVYSLFGRVRDKELSSGFHLVIPLAKVTKMSIRTEEYTMSIAKAEGKRIGDDSIRALTKEGLSVDLDITVLYKLMEEKASDVYKNVGVYYEKKIIRPSIRSIIREVIARYDAKDIYSEKREEAAGAIASTLKTKIAERGIEVEDVLLRNVQLPANLAQSIQEKLQAEQEAEKYNFLLQKEEKEKERKIIEAEGQKEAQEIINRSLTPNYLNYLYIKELKDREGTIYVPVSPENGMPLFKGVN